MPFQLAMHTIFCSQFIRKIPENFAFQNFKITLLWEKSYFGILISVENFTPKRIFKNPLTEPKICGILDMGKLNLRKIENQHVCTMSEIRNWYKPKGIKWNLLSKSKSRAVSHALRGIKMKNPFELRTS